MNHYEIRLGGSGGQGMMLMGDILAQAAGILENREIVLLKSYGPEARGGACRSELITDKNPINYPALSHPDFVLAMSQAACDKYTDDMDKEKGILLTDSGLVENLPHDITHIYSLPLTEIAKNVTGKALAANVTALGAISVLSGQFNEKSVLTAVMNRFPSRLHIINRRAFLAGVSAAKTLLEAQMQS